jgi:hypothetical protein
MVHSFSTWIPCPVSGERIFSEKDGAGISG